MQVLSVLTPPLLVCVVVIAAVVAFLRHEIGRARSRQSAPDEEFSALPDKLDGEDSEPDSGVGAARAPDGDSQPQP